MSAAAVTKDSTRWWMVLLQAVAASLGLALCAAAIFEVQDVRDNGVTELQIEGSFQHVSADAVRDAMLPWLAAGVFGTQMDAIQSGLEQLPWIARARVERAWPGLLRVRLWEHVAYARWNDQLLSEDGAVFRVPALEVPEGLPQFTGPEGRQQQVRQVFDGMRASLRDSGFAPASISLDARGDWVLRTNSGTELRLGRSAPEEQEKFIKGPVSEALAGREAEVKYVDLHYSNGFAVGWRNSAAQGVKQ